MKTPAHPCFVIVLALLLQAFGAARSAAQTAAADWDAFVDRYIEATFADNPGFAVYQGRHEYDGKIADVSRAAIERSNARAHADRAAAAAFDPAALDADRRFEREYVLAEIDANLFWNERYRSWQRSPMFYGDLADPDVYVSRPYAEAATRLKAYLAHAAEIPRVVAAMKQNLRLPLPKTFVETGVKVWGGLGSYLEGDVVKLFAAVEDPDLQRQLQAVTATAAAAAKDATQWLEAQRASADDGYVMGPALFADMLWSTERVDTPLAELAQVGQRDLDRNRAALEDACGRYAPGATIALCLAKMSARKPAQGPVQGARDQLPSLKAFVEKAKLVSIPGTETAGVEEAPPHKRWNSAYIEIPGPYERNLPSVYYIAPPDPSWSAADRESYLTGAAELLFTSIHEVWPGHFLQFLHANRVQRPFGRIFVGYAFAEGWAHYAEELMWEAGYGDGDPEVHLGQIVNALLRNIRFVCAIGLHTQGMSVEACERLFREQGAQDPGNAQQQAARGTFDPAYLNYTLGKLLIRRMREDYTAGRGGRAAWREFHDRLLAFGGPPLPLVRTALIGQSGPLF